VTAQEFRTLCYAKGLSSNRVIEEFMERALAAKDDDSVLASIIGTFHKPVKKVATG
jgi:hypothetical protein